MEFGEYLEHETARSVGFRPSVTVAPDATIADAVARMQHDAVGCLLVIDGDRRLVGIFTERDLLRKVLAGGSQAQWNDPVETVMTPDPVRVHTDDSLAFLLRRMHDGGFRHLPLLDRSGELLGTISIKRVIKFLADQFPQTVYNLPPLPDRFGAAREGA